LYTENDISHAYNASHGIKISSAATYLNIADLVDIVKKHQIDAVHPGYGFMSESAEFAKRMQDEAGVMVVGPGADILQRTGDKLQARRLAEECKLPHEHCVPLYLTSCRQCRRVAGADEAYQ